MKPKRLVFCFVGGMALFNAIGSIAGEKAAPATFVRTSRRGQQGQNSIVSWQQPSFTSPGAALTAQTVHLTPAPDGSALSILFDDLSLQVKATASVSYVVHAVSLTIPMTVNNRRLTGFRTFIRGFANKGANARMVLMSDIAGASRISTFPFGKAQKEDFTYELRSLRPTNANSYTLTLTMIVQNLDKSNDALLTVDSIDIQPVLR